MPKLLVSVRSAREAAVALDAGVDLIDIKEPSAGALGAASPQVIEGILRVVGRLAMTSVACGELSQSAADAVRQLAACDNPRSTQQPARPDFVKVGLSGCGSISDWQEKWLDVLALAPAASTPVAVIYADWRLAGAPPPCAVIQQAQALGRAAILIDTFDKSGPGLLRLVSLEGVQALIGEIRALELQVAVAGQLTFDDAIAVAELAPDYVGVRGGVCRTDRNGSIDAERVVRWQSAMHHFRTAPGLKNCCERQLRENA